MEIQDPNSMNEGAAEAAEAAAYERKQRWKERPGNRYREEELHAMAGLLGPFCISEAEPHVMQLD